MQPQVAGVPQARDEPQAEEIEEREHDFRGAVIEQDGEKVAGTDVISKSSTTLDTDLEAGEYAFYCSVAGHRDAGMEGTLTVE